MAEILGHTQKDLPDAKDNNNNNYEYLASINRFDVAKPKSIQQSARQEKI